MRRRLALLLAVGTFTACSGGGDGGPPLDSSKAITGFSITSPAGIGTVDESAKTIAVTVPYGTNLGALVATFTTTGTVVTVGSTVQASGVTPNDFTTPVEYVVTAEDGTKATYTATVTPASSSAKAIMSFGFADPQVSGTIDDGAKTIAVTVPWNTDVTTLVATFTTTGARVEVDSTQQVSGVTAHDFKGPVVYTVIAADSSLETYTVTVTVAPSPEKAIVFYVFDGVSAPGAIDESAKTISVEVPYGTDVSALVATFETTGATVEACSTVQVSGSTPNDFTTRVDYLVTAADGTSVTYTVTVTVAPDPATRITSFSFASPPSTGVIDGAVGTITLVVPYGTNVTALVATFATDGTSITVDGTPQVSGTTANDFTTPVPYLVTAASGSTATYVVTVIVSPSNAKAITSFSFTSPLAAGIVDEVAKTISVEVPAGTVLDGLVATFVTTGVNVEVGTTVQVSGETPNDFTIPVEYVVTAGDGSKATYTVTVSILAGTVQGTIPLPSSVPAPGRCFMVALGTTPTGNPVALTTGVVTGSSVTYSIANVPPGTYYLYAGVDNDSSTTSPPACPYVSSVIPTRGDFAGYYPGPMPPSTPNVTVTAGSTLTLDFNTLMTMP